MIEQQVATEVASAKAGVLRAETWLKQHERLLIIVFVLAVTAWLGNHYLNNRAQVADQKNIAAQQALDTQKAANVQLATQAQQTATQYQAMVTSLTQQNSQLAAAQQTRTIVLNQQQATDRTLPLPDLGNRWTAVAGLNPGDLTATPNGITVTDAGARQTVTELEKVPVLTTNLQDETTVADNRQTELGKADSLIGDLNGQVTGLNKTIALGDKACDTKIASVKADANKAKRNWFVRGLGIGATVAIFVASKL